MFSRMFHETWGFTLGLEVNPEKTIIPSYKFHSDYHGETGILPGFLGSSTPRLAGKMIGRPIPTMEVLIYGYFGVGFSLA